MTQLTFCAAVHPDVSVQADPWCKHTTTYFTFCTCACTSDSSSQGKYQDRKGVRVGGQSRASVGAGEGQGWGPGWGQESCKGRWKKGQRWGEETRAFTLDTCPAVHLLRICLHFRLGRPLRRGFRVGVALAGVCHVGVNSPGIHFVPLTLWVLHNTAKSSPTKVGHDSKDPLDSNMTCQGGHWQDC